MNGYCIHGQPPVLMPPPADPFGLGDIIERVRAERRAANERAAALDAERNAPAIKAPTREERIAELQQVLARAEHSLLSLEHTQTWGRWTQEEFARKCAADRAARAEARALLADMGVVS